jgi:hypothetical protein
VTDNGSESPTLLEAVTVKVNDPALVGIPDRTPESVSRSPSGKVPVVVTVTGPGRPARVKA